MYFSSLNLHSSKYLNNKVISSANICVYSECVYIYQYYIYLKRQTSIVYDMSLCGGKHSRAVEKCKHFANNQKRELC